MGSAGSPAQPRPLHLICRDSFFRNSFLLITGCRCGAADRGNFPSETFLNFSEIIYSVKRFLSNGIDGGFPFFCCNACYGIGEMSGPAVSRSSTNEKKWQYCPKYSISNLKTHSAVVKGFRLRACCTTADRDNLPKMRFSHKIKFFRLDIDIKRGVS